MKNIVVDVLDQSQTKQKSLSMYPAIDLCMKRDSCNRNLRDISSDICSCVSDSFLIYR